MPRKLLCAAVLGVALTASASDFKALTFEMTDGSVLQVGIDNLSMVPSDNAFIASWAGGSREIPLASLAKFYFSSELTGVSAVEAADIDGVEVFTLTGLSAGRFVTPDEARGNLPAGVYIMKSNGRTLKTVIK